MIHIQKFQIYLARYFFILFLSAFLWFAMIYDSMAEEQGYTLQECIQTALAQNPDIEMAEQDIAVADARKDIARGERWPSLSLRSTYSHFLNPQRLKMINKPNESSLFSEDIWNGNFNLSLPLFTGGRIIQSIKAEELLHLSSEKRLARTRQELVFNVSSVFYDILAQRKVIDSLQFSQQVLEEHMQRINQLIQAERAAKVDLLRTKVQLVNVKQNRISEENKLDIEQQVLVNLMGIENASDPLIIDGELKEEPFSANQESTLGLAYENRSDLEADRAEYQAQAHRVKASAAEQWPTLSLISSYGGMWGIDPAYRQPGASSLEDEGFIGFSVEMPIFTGGRIQAKVREEQAKQNALQEKIRRRRLQIKLEVETAMKTVHSDYQRVLATKTAIDQANESFRIEQEKYTLGKGTITDVLDAQSALHESESNYYRALADLNIAHVQLDLAMGESLWP